MSEQLPCWRIKNMRRRVERARNHPGVTCPCSRHVHLIADGVSGSGAKQYAELIASEPEHYAQSLYAVIESLWKARRRIRDLEKKAGQHPNNKEPAQ